MADSIFSRIINALNTPLPGTGPAKKTTKQQDQLQKAQEAAKASAPKGPLGGPAAKAQAATQVKAVDLQTELRRRAMAIEAAQKKTRDDRVRMDLEAKQREVEEMRRKLEMELAKQGETHAATEQTTYTVQRGDTLSHIAQRFLGKANRWPDVYNANKDKINNPNLIYPGQVLVIPK
jgi:nucleoid-associated protein YgaU